MKPILKSKTKLAPLLAFGAHPDDIEFGCGGVVARKTKAGRPAHFVVCSRGEAGTYGTPAQRTSETKKGAAILGATLEFIKLDGDAHLEVRAAHAIKLAAIIRRVRPGVVLAPSLVENQHPDHSKLGKLVRDATRLARYGGVKELRRWPRHTVKYLFFYAVSPEAEPVDMAKVLFDVSEVVPKWTAAMEAHVSQVKARKYVELQLARARVCGLSVGREYAMALYANDPFVVNSMAQLEGTKGTEGTKE